MVFWGVEIKPGKPYTHSVSEDDLADGSTLHLSQATLGLESLTKERAAVKCKVGEGPELLLCSLIPGVSESCSLDLLFDQDVTFSVVGSTSVHLIGYYMPLEDDENEDDDYDFDGSSEEDSDDDVSVEDDSGMEDGFGRSPSGVRIEEVGEEGAPSPASLKERKKNDEEPKPESKSAQKKRRRAEAAAKAKPHVEVEAKKVETPAAASVEDSDDEDGFAKETPKKKQAVEGADGAATPAAAVTESGKRKKRAKKNKNKELQTPGATTPTPAEGTTPGTPVVTPEPAKDEVKVQGKKEKAKENGAEKTPAPATNGEKTPVLATNGSSAGADKKSAKKGTPAPVKRFLNGLEVYDVAMGKPDAKQAQAGKKVGMIYTGRLKSNGKIFDSNVGKKPFEFRLGVGEVIKGWDVGVHGMRVGDKRKLVIPASMGYGTKGVAGSIPANSVLEFDVELVNVK